MSTVSGVVLQVHCIDDREDQPAIWISIDEWLKTRRFLPLVEVTDGLITNKHPQTCVAGGGYNCFPEDEFADFIVGLPWRYPKNVVLLIQPEDGETRVFGAIRPHLSVADREETERLLDRVGVFTLTDNPTDLAMIIRKLCEAMIEEGLDG